MVRALNDELARTLLENISDSVIATDLGGRIIYWNRGAEQLFGYGPDEALGQTAALIYPDADSATVAADLEKVIAAGEFRGHWRGRRKDGAEVWVDVRTTPMLDQAGTLAGFVGVAKDVTEAHRHAETLRGLAEAAIAINRGKTLQEVLTAITERARQLVGAQQALTVLEDPGGRAEAVRATSVSPAYAARAAHPCDVIGEETAALVRRENRPVRRALERVGQQPVAHNWLGVPLTDRMGHCVGVLQLMDKLHGPFTDCDEHMLVQLAQMAAGAVDNARLLEAEQRAVKLRDDFLQVAAHELNTPLGALRLQLQMLVRRSRRDQCAEEVGRLAEAANKQGKRLAMLVSALLDVSQLDSGTLRVNVEPVDLAEIVRAAVGDLQDAAIAAGCRLELTVDGPLPLCGDRGRLEQVVVNLVSNALKFGAGKPVRVRATREGAMAVLSVADHGIGMEPQKAAHILEKYERAASTDEYGGLGLGLYVTNQVVLGLGGRIEVQTQPGAGATFRALMPLGG